VKDHQRGKPLSPSDWPGVTIPVLVMDGGKSPAWMRNGMRALAGVLPNATYRTLEGQTHMVKANAQVPALVEFFENQHVAGAATEQVASEAV
jgi:pimeloyl-ACP methyl ester carboxylesterase